MGMGFAGIPHVDELASDADSLLPAPVRRDDRAVQDYMRKALVTGPLQRLAQIHFSGNKRPGLGGVDACGEVEKSLRQLVGGLHGSVVAHAVE
jgi:hypothetical protein